MKENKKGPGGRWMVVWRARGDDNKDLQCHQVSFYANRSCDVTTGNRDDMEQGSRPQTNGDNMEQGIRPKTNRDDMG